MSSTPSVMLSAPLPTTVFVVRHAEVHNPKDILYGRLPRFRLSERGQAQAALAARLLAGRPLATIYTSPLLRARQTADMIATYHPAARIRRSQDLIEVRTGYQGSPNSILKKGFSFYEPKKDPNDESMEDIWSRMRRAVERSIARHVGGFVALVSHADPITVLRVGLESRPMTAASLHGVVYPARASITQIVAYPDRPYTVTYFNVADVEEVKL